MNELLQKYLPIVGEEVIQQLMQLASPLRGLKVVHINSTRTGGGVAEILTKMVPLMQALEVFEQGLEDVRYSSLCRTQQL